MKNLWKWNVRSSDITDSVVGTDNRWRRVALGVLLVAAATAIPFVAFGSVESSLMAVQAKIVGTLLPLAAICGLGFAGMSFVMGHPNARNHLIWACVGAIVGFGAESIVTLIRSVIQ